MRRFFLAAFLLLAGAGGAAASYIPGIDSVVRDNTADTAAGIGAPADSAWSGSGSGTLIAILKAVIALLSNTGTPTASGVTSVTSGSASTVFSATSRSFFRIANLNTYGSYDLGCTDDGTTPSSTNYTIRVYASGFYEAFRPGFVSAAAIQCIGLGGTVTIKGEQF